MSMRSAGPLISKLRKRTLARNSDKISSTQSYDSLSGETSRSSVLGSGGNVYAGPRVRVRRGRIGKFPVYKTCDGQSAVLHVAIWHRNCCAALGYLVPITGTSRSSRKMEWYACIGVNRGLLATVGSINTYRHIEIVSNNEVTVERWWWRDKLTLGRMSFVESPQAP
jgi:hypothetical protein